MLAKPSANDVMPKVGTRYEVAVAVAKRARQIAERRIEEQKQLRQDYVQSIRANLRGQLNSVTIEHEDGSRVNLGEKYGHKGTH